jgi:signal transduction histidine kinase/ActR/RegA family two-component response regulator
MVEPAGSPSAHGPPTTPRDATAHDREFRDAREQLAASREILVALGRAGADPAQILDIVVERAMRLCQADVGQLYLVDGDVFRLSRLLGAVPDEFRRYLLEHPMGLNRATLLGRVALDRSSQQIDDVLSDADYGRRDLQRIGGYRTLMSAPMLLEDEVVGVLSMWRTEVDPFDDRERQLLEEFAVQGAIVLRQVELVGALEARGEELASKVAQLEALREVGEAVSSSLDLDEVLAQIVSNAVLLTGTDGGSIMEYDEDADALHVRATYGSSEELVRRLRAITIHRDSTLVGRAAHAGHPLEVPDLAATDLDPHLRILHEDGWRSVLAVPMVRSDRMVGVLVVRRRTTGTFPAGTVELLRTLASQSTLAILNARLFRELATQSRELEEVSRHKSEFLASMSHELRTPLNAVIGFSEVLLDKMFGDLNLRQEEYLRDIWNSGRHLLELLNEILDLSKVEAGQMVLEPTTFRVGGALEYVMSLVRERAALHGITLELTTAEDVGSIEADELRFKQVVLNLVSNAVKFTPDGGRVSVSATREDGDQLAVTVTDTGVGVPPEDRERIFESFQQGGRGAPKEEGTGLGLTLSRRIVELFGGRLWLESVVGDGSTFGFVIPMHPGAGRDRVGPGEEPTDLPLVLLVDDDRASLDLMSAYLDGSVARVVRARDGVEALELVRRVLPAAVVLDMRLPRLDGWQVLNELRVDPATQAIPVVVASVVDERARGLSLGAFEYLLKPVRRDDLVAALRRSGALAETAAGTAGP